MAQFNCPRCLNWDQSPRTTKYHENHRRLISRTCIIGFTIMRMQGIGLEVSSFAAALLRWYWVARGVNRSLCLGLYLVIPVYVVDGSLLPVEINVPAVSHSAKASSPTPASLCWVLLMTNDVQTHIWPMDFDMLEVLLESKAISWHLTRRSWIEFLVCAGFSLQQVQQTHAGLLIQLKTLAWWKMEETFSFGWLL